MVLLSCLKRHIGSTASGGCTKNMNARIAMVAAALLVVLPLGGCTDKESAPPPTSTSTPTPSEDAWRTDYSTEELAAFDEASQFVDAFNGKWQPVLARGKATPEAKQLLQEYRADWRAQWNTLKVFDERKIVIPRAAPTLWSRAKLVKLGDDGSAVVQIVRCVDSTDTGATEDGKPLTMPETPSESTFDVNRDAGGRWLIYSSKSSDTSCAA